MPLGIDATIRYAENNWTEPLKRVRARPRRRRTTRACNAGPAADADRQPRARVAEGGRQAGEDRLPLLRRQAGRVPRVRRARTPSASATSPPTRRRGRRTAARRRRRSADVPRRRGLAGGALALAGDAQRRARGGRACTTGATSSCRCRPARFAETVRALPAAGFRGLNVTIPHKEAALALADEATRHRGRGRRREHAHVRARPARSTPTTPTCPGCSRRCPSTRRDDRARARRGRRGARRRLRAARRRRGRRDGLEPDARARRAARRRPRRTRRRRAGARRR